MKGKLEAQGDVKMIRKEWKAVLRPLYLIENVRENVAHNLHIQ